MEPTEDKAYTYEKLLKHNEELLIKIKNLNNENLELEQKIADLKVDKMSLNEVLQMTMESHSKKCRDLDSASKLMQKSVLPGDNPKEDEEDDG